MDSGADLVFMLCSTFTAISFSFLKGNRYIYIQSLLIFCAALAIFQKFYTFSGYYNEFVQKILSLWSSAILWTSAMLLCANVRKTEF